MKTINAIHVNNIDNCVTLSGPADAGDTAVYIEDGGEMAVIVQEPVPIWHKVAVKPVQKGSEIYKYGAVIGIALEDIGLGRHIHVHNTCSPGAGGRCV